MKRILFTLLFLILTCQLNAQSSNNADVNVKANIIQSISVQKLADIDFGDIPQNTGKHTIPSDGTDAGKIEISSAANKSINISIPQTITLQNSNSDNLTFTSEVPIYNGSDDQGGATQLTDNSGGAVTPQTNTTYVWLGGYVNSDNVNTGLYEGILTVTVSYN